jgi:hypothetical protein
MALEPLLAQFDRVVALPHKFSQIKTRLEDWYDTIMRSFDERYTRSMRSFSIGISFVVVLLLNANLFSLYREISANAAQRELILQSSETIRAELRNRQNASPADVDLTIEQWKRESLDDINRQVSLYTSLGFEGPAWLRHPIAHFQKNGVFHSLAGWIVMALLLSAGAPFWQDTLESLFGLKNLLRKRGKPELSADNPERVR